MKALVNNTTGLVKIFIADNAPDWVDPPGYHLVLGDDLPGGWAWEPKPVVQPEKPMLTPYELKKRLTKGESDAIDDAPYNPDLPIGVRKAMRKILSTFWSATEIRRDDPELLESLNAMVSFGFLAPNRPAELLA